MANEQGQAHADNLDLGRKLQCGVAMAMKVILCASWGGGAAMKVKFLSVMFNLSLWLASKSRASWKQSAKLVVDFIQR